MFSPHGALCIEPASVGDAEWIARAQVAMAQETEDLALDLSTVLKGVQRVIENPSMGFYIVARDADCRPIGCLLVLKEWSDWRNAEVWWIHSVYVGPEYRRRGVFSRMFAYVESLARASGIQGLRLCVDKHNTDAQAVYRSLGMTGEHYALFEKMF